MEWIIVLILLGIGYAVYRGLRIDARHFNTHPDRIIADLNEKLNINLVRSNSVILDFRAPYLAHHEVIFRPVKFSESYYWYCDLVPEGKNYPFRLKSKKTLFPENFTVNIATGDTEFDENLSISTEDRGRTIAVLCIEVRRLILALSKKTEVEINSKLSCLSIETSPDFWKEILAKMVELSRYLTTPAPMPQLLMRNSLYLNEDIHFRLKMIQNLASDFPGRIQDTHYLKELTEDENFLISTLGFFYQNQYELFLKRLEQANREDLLVLIRHLFNKPLPDLIFNFLYLQLFNEDQQIIHLILIRMAKNNLFLKKEQIEGIFGRKKDFYTANTELLIPLIRVIPSTPEYYELLIDLLENYRCTQELLILLTEKLAEIGQEDAISRILPFTGKNHPQSVRRAAKRALEVLRENIPPELRGGLTLENNWQEGELSLEDSDLDGRLSDDTKTPD